MTNAVQLAQYGSVQNSFKNRIINGGMVIDQRNAGAVSSALNGYFIDRWTALRGAGTITPVFSGQQVSDAPAGFINSAKITVTTAGTGTYYSLLRQYIEGLNVSDLGFGTASAATVTLSFWVKSSIAGVYAAGIQNASGDRTYVSNYTISVANTWEQKSITIAGDTTGTWATNNSAGILVNFDLGTSTGTQATPNTWANQGIYTSTSIKWANTLSATFYITGVQLEKGSTATSFDYRPYGTEFLLCQRYFETGSVWKEGTNAGAGAQCVFTETFKVVKRGNATFTFGNVNGANANITSISGPEAMYEWISPFNQTNLTTGFAFRFVPSNATSTMRQYWLASAEL